MANPITRVLAAIRRQPALAIAVGGVGLAAAVSVGRRGAEEPAPPTEAVATPTAQPIAGYGPGLSAASPLDAVLGDPYAGERASATATLTSAINAGNASIAEAIRQAIAGRGSVQPLPPVKITPAPVSPPPVKQPTPAPKPPSAAQKISRATAASLLRKHGQDPGKVIGWGRTGAAASAGWINSPAALYVWRTPATFEAWIVRTFGR